MIAQPLRPAGPAACRDDLEHVRHVLRIVAGARHDLRAFGVGLALVFTAEPHERRAEPEARSLGDDAADTPADDRADDRSRERTHLVLRGFARLSGAMPQRDVAQ